MTDWIAETVTSTTGWDHLESLVDVGNRMAGSRIVNLVPERLAVTITRYIAFVDVEYSDPPPVKAAESVV